MGGKQLVIGTCPVNYWAFRRPRGTDKVSRDEMDWNWNSHWCSERVTRRESDVLVTWVATGWVGSVSWPREPILVSGIILCMVVWVCCTRGHPKIDQKFF